MFYSPNPNNRHPLYGTWKGMRARCNCPSATSYEIYGGRGISVCERWSDFQTFAADMGEKPSPQHSIERIDNDGNYEPSNCRWASKEEQVRNQRLRKDANLNSWWRQNHN